MERKQPSLPYLPALDGLRGVAVLLVLWAHSPLVFQPYWLQQLRYFVQPNYLGVDVFFVLSGFLITRILLHSKARGDSLARFYWRRSLRIFPIYFLLIAALVFAEPGWYLLWSAAYLLNLRIASGDAPSPLAHTWSLCVEEHYYLVWPCVVYFTARPLRMLLYVAIPLSLVSAGAVHYLCGPECHVQLRTITTCRVLSLSLGGLLAFYEARLTYRLTKQLGSVLLLGLAVAPIVKLAAPDFLALGKFFGFSLASTGIVLVCMFSTSRLLNAAWLRYVGRISYGLYLYHYPIFYFLWPTSPPETAAVSFGEYLLALAVTFGVAALSWRFFESPLLRLKDRSIDWPVLQKQPQAANCGDWEGRRTGG